jgi:NADPH-dependent ferric siderophore reductase
MVQVAALQRLSPSFLRITFTGDDLNLFADNGFDQRIKVAVPLPQHGVSTLPTGLDWHSQWRALPESERNPIRTYTVRYVRHEVSEVDVDFVLDGEGHGPASAWAAAARVGDKLALMGPDARYDGEHGGIDFRSPTATDSSAAGNFAPAGDSPAAGNVLLAGDETAVPAIASILECLAPQATGDAILEVPLTADFLSLTAPAGVKVTWLARHGAPHGSALIPAVKASAATILPRKGAQAVEDIDVDNEILWEVADTSTAWVAGEAAVVRELRRHLIAEHGLDRSSAAFLGYWRAGKPENNG